MPFVVPQKTSQALGSVGKYLLTDVEMDVINSLVSWILSNRPEKSQFTIVINSSGGDPGALAYFASFVATLDPTVEITGVAFGECGSAALGILQCCHKRIAVQHCGFFVHHMGISTRVHCHGDPQVLQRKLAALQEMEESMVRLQTARTGISKEAWHQLADEGEQNKGRAILPDRALALGLVDEVVAHYPIF